MSSKTPRTDAEEREIYSEGNYGMGKDYAEHVVDASFARQLETELSNQRALASELVKQRNTAEAERDDLRARVAELDERYSYIVSENAKLCDDIAGAEQRNAELVAALRLFDPDRFHLFDESASDRVADAFIAREQALTRAESATPAKNAADTPENREACAKIMADWAAEECSPAKHPDTEPEIIGEYGGKDGRRDWWSGSAWLRPGQSIAIVNSTRNP